MSKSGSLRGALGGLYAHNAAESKKAREETRVSKMIRESDRQFHQQVRRTSHLCALFHSTLDQQGPQSTAENCGKDVQAVA
jgi:hypothetical protein